MSPLAKLFIAFYTFAGIITQTLAENPISTTTLFSAPTITEVITSYNTYVTLAVAPAVYELPCGCTENTNIRTTVTKCPVSLTFKGIESQTISTPCLTATGFTTSYHDDSCNCEKTVYATYSPVIPPESVYSIEWKTRTDRYEGNMFFRTFLPKATTFSTLDNVITATEPLIVATPFIYPTLLGYVQEAHVTQVPYATGNPVAAAPTSTFTTVTTAVPNVGMESL
ncbi:hypothetical protein SJAG_00367 [Schizosaccharomyces japonicus yFS275]|uniref:Uncharacterized protein n=1 Tax=Schizosaccharomyces japonicus (strain yFS275 / FY16936) TaxID=402676 RepID=B6JVF7_SCHJY|nr:hypothetical protein SJAG_00367 [Schizosaccharomyces japonicus yFS275]EEB05358.1 hypothetical protein SJAG_00367 [Schizosaccharomyces japonicus yFS275]